MIMVAIKDRDICVCLRFVFLILSFRFGEIYWKYPHKKIWRVQWRFSMIHWIGRQAISKSIKSKGGKMRMKKNFVNEPEWNRKLLKMWSITFWLNCNLQHKHFSPLSRRWRRSRNRKNPSQTRRSMNFHLNFPYFNYVFVICMCVWFKRNKCTHIQTRVRTHSCARAHKDSRRWGKSDEISFGFSLMLVFYDFFLSLFHEVACRSRSPWYVKLFRNFID